MGKENVYIHQFLAPSSRNLLPLAAGLLYSYAMSIPKIRENYNFTISFLRDQPGKIVTEYSNPKVVAFSTYFWNYNLSLKVAEMAKKKYPCALMVFGGPAVPLKEQEVRAFFQRYPFVDVIVPCEGEIVFSDILLALLEGRDFGTVEGISHKESEGRVVFKEKRPYLNDLSKIPSPYMDGTFDDLLSRHRAAVTGAIFETNRGCPFTCTYCFWGGPDSKVIQFPLERVYAELDWVSKNKIEYLSGADANFGILSRDADIAKYIADLNKKNGYPKYLAINWTKNSSRTIFKIADTLSSSGIRFMITASAQSFNPDTLKAIKRSNIRLEDLKELIKEAGTKGYDIYSELILGLPLESYESFKTGIEKVLVPKINYHFNIYYCYLITSSEMANPEYLERYKIQTRRCEVSFERTVDAADSIPEYEDIVVSTSSMPVDDWKRSFTFGYFAKAIYGYRTAFFILNYLREEHSVDLLDLIEFIIRECSNNPRYHVISRSLTILESLKNSILNNDRETIKIEGVATSLHPEMAVLITLLAEKEQFYRELADCLEKYFKNKDIQINKDAYNDVLVYQVSVIPTWHSSNLHKVKFNHNLTDYFNSLGSDSKVKIHPSPEYLIIDAKESFKSADDFMSKRIYGGLKFSISSVGHCKGGESLDSYLNARDAFEAIFNKNKHAIQLGI